jgi:dolichyl-phosphate beta-glucosyltransferase
MSGSLLCYRQPTIQLRKSTNDNLWNPGQFDGWLKYSYNYLPSRNVESETLDLIAPMSASIPFLSVIVPVYNESSRINSLDTLYEYLNKQDFESEVIIVNDGSTDDTLAKLELAQKRFDLQILDCQPNRGKGHAIQQGMLAARGKYRLFTDVDLSTPITEFDKFLPFLAEKAIIIATRKRQGAAVLVHQAQLRETLGKGFTFLSQLILQLQLSDFTCGFKCFSAEAAAAVFPKLTIARWGFDAEQLFIARLKGFSIKEIPVMWTNDPQTKVRLPQDIIRSLSDLLIVRLNHLKHRYD